MRREGCAGMDFRVNIKTESFCSVTVEADDVFEAIDIVQNGDFINDPACSGYSDNRIIQNIESIEDEDGNDVLEIKKVML